MARGNHAESFRTYTGHYVWPLDPKPHDINVSDIAHALARINRFNGHTAIPYSVAEHAVRVSWLVNNLADCSAVVPRHSAECANSIDPKQRCNCGTWFAEQGNWELLTFWGLHHDDSEYLLVDFPRPMKLADTELGKAYRTAEGRLMACICASLHIPVQQPYLVGVADKVMLLAEQRDLMGAGRDDMDPLPAEYRKLADDIPEIKPWGCELAELRYLQTHTTLKMLREKREAIASMGAK